MPEMTGLDRLRELAEGLQPDRDLWYLTSTEYDRAREGRGERHIDSTLNEMLASIADQIEAEQDERITRRVEDREAAEWVRERGGLEKIKRQRRESVPREAYERKRRALLDHIAECEAALRKRRDAIARIVDENDALRLERATMRPRLMPEGMEWPKVDGGPVVIGERLVGYGSGDDGYEVVGVRPTCGWVLVKAHDHIHRDGGSVILEWDASKCHRPAPKVLDADGEEIRVGDEVWSTRESESGTVVYAYPPGDDGQPSVKVGAFWHHASELTHRSPVLAADGRPLREGETVWVTKDSPCDAPLAKGDEVTVKRAYPKIVSVEDEAGNSWVVYDDHLTHERPESKCRDCAHWQKDPTADRMGVCWFYYHEHEGQDCYAARLGDIGACEEFVPRGKALAERDA